MGRVVVALLKAASVRQLAVLALVVIGSVLVLSDVLWGDPPSAQPQPVAQPPDQEPRSLLELVLGGASFARFAGFCALSVGILSGMLLLFWRHIRRSD